MQSLTPRKERHVDFRVQSLDKLNQEDFNTEAKSRNRVNKTTVLSPASDTHKNTLHRRHASLQPLSLFSNHSRQLEAS